MNLLKFLNSGKTYRILLILNFLIAIGVFYLFRNTTGGDTKTYLGLADGILSGSYSYWYFLDQPFPDTFRNPGYPLFLAAIRFFTDSILVIQLIQMMLYFGAILLVLAIIEILYDRQVVKNIFLLMLLFSIHVAAYISYIFPEIIVTFLILLSIWINLKYTKDTWSKYLVLGLLYGFIFQIRPVFLFLPILLVFVNFFTQRNRFSFLKQVAMLSVFALTMIPYGLWNKTHHGVFKITSLEGGGGVFHLGYWMFKLPDYYEPRYWRNYCTRELISFIDEADREKYIRAYNTEWDKIDSACAPSLTATDSTMLQIQKQYHRLFKTYSSSYTLKREALLKEYTLKNIESDLAFYIKAKIYSAVRLWVTGIPLREFNKASPLKKLYLMYPFLVTLITFCAGFLIPVAFYKYKKEMMPLTAILMITLYFGIIHIPFTIQSRYTIPVRLELLMMIAVSVYLLFFNKDKNNQLLPDRTPNT